MRDNMAKTVLLSICLLWLLLSIAYVPEISIDQSGRHFDGFVYYRNRPDILAVTSCVPPNTLSMLNRLPDRCASLTLWICNILAACVACTASRRALSR